MVLQTEKTLEFAPHQFGEFVGGGVDDHHAVMNHAVLRPKAVDFEAVPMAGGTADVLLGRGDGVYASAELVGLNVAVAIRCVVEDLHLDATELATGHLCHLAPLVRAVGGHPHVKSRVAARLEQVFKPQVEVAVLRSEEHTSELQSPDHLVCRLLLEKKKTRKSFRLSYIINSPDARI